MRLNKTFFDIAYPKSPYDTAKNLARKAWLKNALQFLREYLLELISTNNLFLFRSSLDVDFLMCKSQNYAVNRKWII